MSEKRYFHYTTGNHLPRIIESGFIETNSQLEATAKPMAWFSTATDWEHSVCKSIIEDGVRRSLDKLEICEICNGLFRVEIRSDYTLMDWPETIADSQLSEATVKQLESKGIERGSDPMEWYTSLERVHRGDWIALDMWEPESGNWLPIEL